MIEIAVFVTEGTPDDYDIVGRVGSVLVDDWIDYRSETNRAKLDAMVWRALQLRLDGAV